jgi:transglutaminase-like putative cysteine protease
MSPGRSTAEHLRALLWCSAAFVGAVLLHLEQLSLWATLVALACASWAVAAARGLVRLPARGLRAAMALALTAVVLGRFHTLNGLSAGTALLVVMGSIKLLEAQRRRDRLIVVGAALFLLLAACLEQQGLGRVPLYALHAWLCCAALAVIASPERGFGDRAALALAARSMLFALPLALVLFAFFPRLSGSFWALPKSGQAVTGLSDMMDPGSISELTESNDPALRVRFEGAPPPPQERYWRGPVLHEFNGYQWRASATHFYLPHKWLPIGPAYRYRVTLEPSAGLWWFALDTIDGEPPHAHLTFDRQLVGFRPVTQPLTYEAESHTETRSTDALSRYEREYDLDFPRERNPRAQALAVQLRGAVESPERFAQSVLEVFRRGGFEYTLTPPRTDLNSVDDFLFNTRSGFCGHFASAFVLLMRAGGVPARVVTGYLGGEWNPFGGYFVIRQSDAHAWAEIWIDGRGWVRVDPTGVVAPERLQRGILDLLPNAVSGSERLMHGLRWLSTLRQSWDAANAWWADRFIGYDMRAQLSLLRDFGIPFPGWSQLGWGLAAGLAAWLMLTAWQLGRLPRAPRPDRLAHAYGRLCAKLARIGLARVSHHGPLAYGDWVALRRPDLDASVRPLLARYAELRFGPQAGEAAVSAFEQAVRALRLRARGSRGN